MLIGVGCRVLRKCWTWLCEVLTVVPSLVLSEVLVLLKVLGEMWSLLSLMLLKCWASVCIVILLLVWITVTSWEILVVFL